MSGTDCIVTYQFTLAETKAICALFHDRRVPGALAGFSKTLLDALMKHISIEEAERLFNDQRRA